MLGRRRKGGREEEEQGARDRADYVRRRRAREARHAMQEKEERRRGSHAMQEEEERRRGFRREEEDQVRSRRQEGGSYRSRNKFPPLSRPGNARRGAGPAPRARA